MGFGRSKLSVLLWFIWYCWILCWDRYILSSHGWHKNIDDKSGTLANSSVL